MKALISLAAVYVFACAVLPAAIARLRGHGPGGVLRVFAVGLLAGWTGYGALLAWMDAVLAPERDLRILIR